MQNNKQIALIVCLDQNKINKYEYECLFCIKTWQTKKHKLSDIDIIVYVEKNITIHKSTLTTLHAYPNIQFRQYEFNCKYLFLNTLYCQYLFETYETAYEYGIYIDLDLYLKHDIPKNYIFQDKTIFCIYTELNKIEHNINYRLLNNIKMNLCTFNTYFIINNRKNMIFTQLINLINSSQYDEFFNKNILYKNDSFYYEEGIYDYAQSIGIINNRNSRFIDVKHISENTNALFTHKHITTFYEYISLCKNLKKN